MFRLLNRVVLNRTEERKSEAKEYKTKEADSQYLNADAFKRPEEKKAVAKKYNELYLREEPIFEYHLERKLFDTKKTQREKFKSQFATLLDAIEKWGKNNNCNTDAIRANIANCKKDFFDASYSGQQTTEYFAATKQNLETIWFALSFDKRLTIARKKEIYNYLCSSMNVCAPGLYSHIEDICNSLNIDVSLEQWLAEFRTSIIRLYAEKHIIEHQIKDGYNIHVYTAFLNYALQEGWNPSSNVDKHKDPFAGAMLHIEAEHLVDFSNYFQETYRTGIINSVSINFFSELSKYKHALAVKEDKEGWLPYSVELYKKIQELAKVIGITDEDGSFLDLSEDSTKMRFNINNFQTAFLVFCKRNGKIFSAECWQEIVFENKYKYSTFELAPKFTWFEKPNVEIIHWQSLIDDSDAKTLWAQLMAQIPTENWKLVTRRTINDISLFIKNGTDLGNVFAELHERDKIIGIIDLLGLHHPNSLINSNQNVSQVLDCLTSEMKWKMDLAFGVFAEIILLRAVEAGDHVTFQKLLDKTNFFNAKKDGPTLLTRAVEKNHIKIVKLLKEYEVNIDEINHDHHLSKIVAVNGNLPMLNMLGLHEGKSTHMVATFAVKNKHIKVLQKLVESKCDLRQKNEEGETLLHIAADLGHVEIVQLLIQHQPELDAPNSLGLTPVYYAAREGRTAALQLLINCKSDIQQGRKDYPPAWIATKNGHVEALKILAENKADLQFVTPDGKNLAHFAAEYNQAAILQFLVKYKVDLNKKDATKVSPMQIAAKKGHLQILKILSEHSGDENHMNKQDLQLAKTVLRESKEIDQTTQDKAASKERFSLPKFFTKLLPKPQLTATRDVATGAKAKHGT